MSAPPAVRTAIIALSAAILAAPGALGADPPPLVTDRPDETESATVVPRGLVQIESGFAFSSGEASGVEVEVGQLPATLLRTGLSPRVELRVGWDGWVSQRVEAGGIDTDTSGAGDTSLGAKVLLREGRGAAPQLAVLFAGTLPTGDDAVGSDRIDPSARLAAEHILTDRVGFGWNAGASWSTAGDLSGEPDTLGAADYTAALGVALDQRWSGFVELFGSIPLSASGGPQHLLDGGLTYLARDNLQFDVSAGAGLSDDAADWLFGVGLSVRLPR